MNYKLVTAAELIDFMGDNTTSAWDLYTWNAKHEEPGQSEYALIFPDDSGELPNLSKLDVLIGGDWIWQHISHYNRLFNQIKRQQG
jgi:hypothetical protein